MPASSGLFALCPAQNPDALPLLCVLRDRCSSKTAREAYATLRSPSPRKEVPRRGRRVSAGGADRWPVLLSSRQAYIRDQPVTCFIEKEAQTGVDVGDVGEGR